MRLVAGVIFILIQLGCESERAQLEKFVFDTNQIASRTVHQYEFYENGKIKVDHSIEIDYRLGIPVDTTISRKIYHYTKTGKISSIVSADYFFQDIRTYDEVDSLVGEYQINSHGDTTRLMEFKYKDGMMIATRHRSLLFKIPDNIKDVKNPDLRSYDTLSFWSKFVYEAKKLSKTIEVDKNGNVIEETQHYYIGETLVKSITYSYLGDTEYVSRTRSNIPDGTDSPDFVTIGPLDDTIEFQKTIQLDTVKIVKRYFQEINSRGTAYYNREGLTIADIFLDFGVNEKTVRLFKFDKKGNPVEEVTYTERLLVDQ
jgi:hypothetical protein